MRRPPIIGLTGYARSGKDSVARVLSDRYGYRQVAFADALKAVLADVDPYIPDGPVSARRDDRQNFRRLHPSLEGAGWELTKSNPEVRRLLQALGDSVRSRVGENAWVVAVTGLIDLSPREHWVISDVRYPNEAAAIVGRGGHIWRIERPGVGPVNDHPSETSMEDWVVDQTLRNDGTLDVLSRRVGDLVGGGAA